MLTVRVLGNELIADLKWDIHEQGISALRLILAKDLVLLKVSHILEYSENIAAHFSMVYQVDVDLEPHNDESLSKLAIQKDDEGVEKLKDWKTISYFWPDQPAIGRLHVFIKLPSSGE